MLISWQKIASCAIRSTVACRWPTASARNSLRLAPSWAGRRWKKIATMTQPDTILAWNRKFVDQQADTSKPQTPVGRPRVGKAIKDLVVRMARENRTWGYDRIQGALNHLGYTIRDQAVGNILKRH